MVLSRESLGRKIGRISRRMRLFDAVEGMEEAAKHVGRYLRRQLLINAIFGVAVATIMMALGLPNALMWGLLGGLLRYVPYLGPLVALIAPTALALAIAPGWSKPALTFALLLVLESITNLVLEPLLYGNSTGVSSLGVVMSAIFWGWLWGTPGLLLGMPLTVCFVVIGKHIKPLQLLSEVLSAEVDPGKLPSTAPGAVVRSKSPGG